MDYRLKKAYDDVYNKVEQPNQTKFRPFSSTYTLVYEQLEDDNENENYITLDEDQELSDAVLKLDENLKKFGTSPQKEERYVPRINKMLQSGAPLQYGVKGKEGLTFTPYTNQTIGSLTDKIKGIDDSNNEVLVQASNLYKEAAEPNKGEVAEGLLGIALFKRFVSTNNISPSDVLKEIERLKSHHSQGVINTSRIVSENNIADTFELIVRLKERSMDGLLNLNWVQTKMKKILPQICNFANVQSVKYVNYFRKNQKADVVVIKSDGVSGEGKLKQTSETEDSEEISKTDVEVYVKNADNPTQFRRLAHLNLSVKTGTTKQIGQHGGGRVTDSLEDRFKTVIPFWARFGIDIQDLQEDFVKQKNIFEAYKFLYKNISSKFNSIFVKLNQDAEKRFLNTLIKALNFFGAANKPNLRLVQFTEKGFYTLDFNKTNRLLESDMGLEFESKYSIGKSGMPQIDIINPNIQTKNNIFLRIRTYKASGGYLRNYVEKGPRLISLLKSKSI